MEYLAEYLLDEHSKKKFEADWKSKGAKLIGNMWTYENRPFFYVHESVKNTLEDYEQAHIRLKQIRLGL